MRSRQERMRLGLESGNTDFLESDEPGWAEDAEYHVPAAGVSVRGRADIEKLVNSMRDALDVKVLSMEENGPLMTVHVEVENRTPGLEYKGPAVIVVKGNDKDEIVEWWSFRA